MPLTTDTYLLGMHAWFFRSGDSVTVAGNYSGADTGAASKNRRPGAADPAWISMGAIEEGEIERGSTDLETWIPSPGALRRNALIQTKDSLTYKFTCSELSAFLFEVLMGTLALNSSSTQFNPLEGGIKLGWLKVQFYDQADSQRMVKDVWGRLKLAGPVQVGGSDIVKPQFEFGVLHSTLNSGTL